MAVDDDEVDAVYVQTNADPALVTLATRQEMHETLQLVASISTAGGHDKYCIEQTSQLTVAMACLFHCLTSS